MSAEALQADLMMLFGLPTVVAVALAFRTVQLRVQDDPKWKMIWKRTKITSILAVCCLPVVVVTGFMSYERQSGEDKAAVVAEAAHEAHVASLTPAQKFQECLDDHFGIDACSSAYGTKAEYVAWMEAKGYTPEVAQSMANLPPGDGAMMKAIKECASGGSCN